ncbi:hypothetical protein HHK36_002933 [Tetracentron sinense]|uniref:Uncharacterized protein n=1 Tax=Tetracentron sinense TaxID=13715 RepID=A0A835DRK9_TETSI|nr:hypothetical protein HHK36_002933 [Tetracentron sinense]
MSNANEVSSKPSGLHSHGDLARKLQVCRFEEMDKNRKASSDEKLVPSPWQWLPCGTYAGSVDLVDVGLLPLIFDFGLDLRGRTCQLVNPKPSACIPCGLDNHNHSIPIQFLLILDWRRFLQYPLKWLHFTGSKSDESGSRMREVACPICTVHLQVSVPSSGSETIECGVCQHPFLVSAH